MKKETFKLILTVESNDDKYSKNVLLGKFDDWKTAKRLQDLTKDIYKEIQRVK